MPWKKGQSGNPNGRPPKNRALTTILERYGSHTIEDTDGKRRCGKRVVARMVWEIATTGQAKLPDGKTLTVSPSDWFGIVKWLYSHIDGPAQARHSLELLGEGGGPVTLRVVYDDEPRSSPAEGAPEAS